MAAVALPGTPTVATSTCGSGGAPLTVVASPEIAPVIATVVRVMASGEAGGTSGAETARGRGCPAPVLRAADPADTLASLATNAADRPDVWIPDSSAWTTRLNVPGTGVPVDNPSVTSSPYVLAIPVRPATALHPAGTLLKVAQVLPGAPGASAPIRWAFPDPTRSIRSAAAISALLTDLTGTKGEAAALTALVRAGNLDVGTGLDDTLARTRAVPTAVPTTEQQAFVHNRDHAASPVALAYGDKTSLAADYPFVMLSTERTRRLQATSLLDALTGEFGRRLLAANGFRDVNGIPGAVLTAQAGIDHATITPQKPDAAALRKATSALATVRRGSRLLAVVDVSGSMSSDVPGARGATRLDLALKALTTGLAVYPDDTVAGLWTFSTNLTPTTDYRALVQPVVLGTGPDGTSGRARLAQALASVGVKPDGDTGLYDTVLAAVRMMRKTWDPDRVNSVVVVTDGANDDPHGISLATLLRTLGAERDATRPVGVFAIAYGPSADVVPLRQITAAAGGTVYAARDPRTIGSVLQDAIGRRVCTTSCS
jgi:Mg-chelatase subunit ChlD